jgi:hypothetical protein
MFSKQYRRKPITVMAEQWLPGKVINGVCQCDSSKVQHLHSRTGLMLVLPGDYIVTGVRGEKYPVSSEVFSETYEEVPAAPGGRLPVLILILVLVASAAEARKKPKQSRGTAAPDQVDGPRRNFLNLRDATWSCGEQGCAVDVTSLGLIACNPNGCGSITDVIVSTGPVLRRQP